MIDLRFRNIVLAARIWLNEDVFELRCSRPADFAFLAGQHVTLGYQGEERDYTLISAPQDRQLRFLVRRVQEGRLSVRLAELPLGAELAISEAKGYLICQGQSSPKRETVFVATGVGIAPFVAMAGDGVRDFTLIHGARFANGLFYRNILSRAAKKYVPCLSGPVQVGDLSAVFHGRVTGYVTEQLAPGLYDFYLCGARPMVHDMTHLLDQKFPDARVYNESFT